MISLVKWYEPDLNYVVPETHQADRYSLHSFLLNEQVMVVQQCDENGRPLNDWSKRIYACRLVGEQIQVCIPSHGWLPVYEEIQGKYNEILAEKQLLEN